MKFLFFAAFFAAAIASEITVHNQCPTQIYIKPDAPGSTGAVSPTLFL
jgi:hypothetical protein